MCRRIGWICVDLGLGREIPQDLCYQDRDYAAIVLGINVIEMERCVEESIYY